MKKVNVPEYCVVCKEGYLRGYIGGYPTFSYPAECEICHERSCVYSYDDSIKLN